MQAWQHNPAQTLGRRECTRRRQQNRPSRKLRRHYQPLAGTTTKSHRRQGCRDRRQGCRCQGNGSFRRRRSRQQRQGICSLNVDALLSWPGSNRNTQPRISSRNTQPLAGSPAGSRQQSQSQRRRGAAHAAARRAERGKAFRGHGRQSLDPLGTEPLAGMARVPRTMRRYKDSTSAFPDIATSGAEPEPPNPSLPARLGVPKCAADHVSACAKSIQAAYVVGLVQCPRTIANMYSTGAARNSEISHGFP